MDPVCFLFIFYHVGDEGERKGPVLFAGGVQTKLNREGGEREEPGK